MAVATLSSKYQLVIPKDIRQRAAINAGQRFHVLVKSGIIHLIPIVSLQDAQGSIPKLGKNLNIREKKDRI